MNIALAIMHIYPNLKPMVDYRVTQENDVQSIAEWNNGNTQPTSDQLNAAWLEVVKEIKKSELDAKCDQAIMSGFTSTALGTAHTYPSDFQAMVFFNATLNRFANDPTFTTANQKTVDSGYLAHTKQQFTQVFNDGHAFGETQIAHLNDLKSQVDSATTIDAIDGIQW